MLLSDAMTWTKQFKKQNLRPNSRLQDSNEFKIHNSWAKAPAKRLRIWKSKHCILWCNLQQTTRKSHLADRNWFRDGEYACGAFLLFVILRPFSACYPKSKSSKFRSWISLHITQNIRNKRSPDPRSLLMGVVMKDSGDLQVPASTATLSLVCSSVLVGL